MDEPYVSDLQDGEDQLFFPETRAEREIRREGLEPASLLLPLLICERCEAPGMPALGPQPAYLHP
jgi:hypothetical protein